MPQRSIDFPLGDLELEVLEHLWAHGPADVRAVHEALSASRQRQPNTIQSTLERLFRKGVLDRTKRSRAFIYAPRLDRESFLLSSIQSISERLGAIDRGALLASFLETEGEDEALLDQLQAMIDARRGKPAGT